MKRHRSYWLARSKVRRNRHEKTTTRKLRRSRADAERQAAARRAEASTPESASVAANGLGDFQTEIAKVNEVGRRDSRPVGSVGLTLLRLGDDRGHGHRARPMLALVQNHRRDRLITPSVSRAGSGSPTITAVFFRRGESDAVHELHDGATRDPVKPHVVRRLVTARSCATLARSSRVWYRAAVHHKPFFCV